MITAALAALMLIFTFIRWIDAPSAFDRTIWAWLGLALAILVAVGAWMNMQASGESLADIRASVAGASASAKGAVDRTDDTARTTTDRVEDTPRTTTADTVEDAADSAAGTVDDHQHHRGDDVEQRPFALGLSLCRRAHLATSSDSLDASGSFHDGFRNL